MTFATSDLGTHADALICDEALQHLDGRVTRAGPARWRFAYAGEGNPRTIITLDDDWLVVERTPSRCRVTRRAHAMPWIWRLLRPQLALSSGARAVLPAGETSVRIRAERPVLQAFREDPAPLGRWIATACADAASCDGGTPITAADFEAADTQKQLSGTGAANIPDLCALAGWSATMRGASEQAVIELPARDDGVCRAVATWDGRTARFHVELGTVGETETTPVGQPALAVVLLRAAESVRLVRSTAARNDGRVSAALEVCLQPPIGIELLDHALSALACAHRQIALELGVLACDDALASAYLALQGVR